MGAPFKITLFRSNLSAPAKSKNGRLSMVNLRKEIQEEIILCKTLMHNAKRKNA